jgi:hypothetical protein
MNNYIRHEKLTLMEVLPILQAVRSLGKDHKEIIRNWKVGVSSLRLRTFARDGADASTLCCSECGLQAKFFAIETFANGNQETAHINLYGIHGGKDVLFTHDHTLARSLGGSDTLSNSTTMCSPCNSFKSKAEGEERARRLQEARDARKAND